MWRRRRTLALGLCLVALSATFAPVSAAPLMRFRDHADNSLSFTYNESQGELTSATSSRMVKRGDRVDFLTGIADHPKAALGQRLTGILSLHLLVDRRVVYDGTFFYRVKNSQGEVVFTGTDAKKVVLRPLKGERTARMSFDFDVPSGGYAVVGRFRAAEA
jgi:hypothetical protein